MNYPTSKYLFTSANLFSHKLRRIYFAFIINSKKWVKVLFSLLPAPCSLAYYSKVVDAFRGTIVTEISDAQGMNYILVGSQKKCRLQDSEVSIQYSIIGKIQL